MSPSYNSMREPLNVFLRVLPWLMTTVSANVIHYFSLWIAREEAHRQVLEAATPTTSRRGRWYPGSDPEEHERLSFDLMDSPAMRKARTTAILVTVLVARLALFRREYIECLRSLQDPFRTKKGDYCAQEVAFICSRPSS